MTRIEVLQQWRDADHEDVLMLSRNDVIGLLEEAYRWQRALKSIEASACCDGCQEAQRVAHAALLPERTLGATLEWKVWP